MTVGVQLVRTEDVPSFYGAATRGGGYHLLHHARRVVRSAALTERANDDRERQTAGLRQREQALSQRGIALSVGRLDDHVARRDRAAAKVPRAPRDTSHRRAAGEECLQDAALDHAS